MEKLEAINKALAAELENGRLRAALEEIERLRLATDEGTLAKRADRMWEIACEALGRPIPGAKPFVQTHES